MSVTLYMTRSTLEQWAHQPDDLTIPPVIYLEDAKSLDLLSNPHTKADIQVLTEEQFQQYFGKSADGAQNKVKIHAKQLKDSPLLNEQCIYYARQAASSVLGDKLATPSAWDDSGIATPTTSDKNESQIEQRHTEIRKQRIKIQTLLKAKRELMEAAQKSEMSGSDLELSSLQQSLSEIETELESCQLRLLARQEELDALTIDIVAVWQKDIESLQKAVESLKNSHRRTPIPDFEERLANLERAIERRQSKIRAHQQDS